MLVVGTRWMWSWVLTLCLLTVFLSRTRGLDLEATKSLVVTSEGDPIFSLSFGVLRTCGVKVLVSRVDSRQV